GVGAGIGEHAAHLLLDLGTVVQAALAGEVEQFVVRDTAPEEEGETGSQFVVVDPVNRAALDIGRVALDAEEKARRDEHGTERLLDAAVKIALGASALVKREQRPE